MVAFVLGLVIVVSLLLLAAFASLWGFRQPSDALEELGVKTTYTRASLPSAKIDAYCELKDEFVDSMLGHLILLG